MTIFEQFYTDIVNKTNEISLRVFNYDDGDLQSINYNYSLDFIFWINLLESRKESILLKCALKEYLVGQVLLTQGFYKHSFICLRNFLEQTLFAIFLSINELHFRQWQENKKDLMWSEIVDLEKGIFSKSYIECFYPEVCENSNEFFTMATKVYRECSEFVHGNFSTHEHTITLEFKDKTFLLWHETANTIQLIITFCLFVRYNEFINSKDLLNKVERNVLDRVGYLETIRNFFDKDL